MTSNPRSKDGDPKDLLEWLGLTDVPNWKVARPLGALFGLCLTLLFALAFAAAVWTVLKTFVSPDAISTTLGGGLGTGALIVALLGAPFLIWNTVIKHRALGFQKEGHLTDRISKAVEQLGAEKKVDRIGRPVTIWTGKAERFSCAEGLSERYLGKPRTKSFDREWRQDWNHEKDEVEEGYQVSVATWPAERTIVQWQGEAVGLEGGESIGVEGEWQAFSETFPNIEVRIGGILSLERIAQDSMAFDKGRDHVRVMEILCAYVRENARVMNLEPTLPPFKTKVPRIDIQTAMTVIKRRTVGQVQLEAAARYRLDLRQTDLDGCDLRSGKFTGAIFWRSRLEAADLRQSDLTGTQFNGCMLNFVHFRDATLRGTNLDGAIISLPIGASELSFLTGNVQSVSVVGAELSALDYIGDDPTKVFGSKDTKLSENLQEMRDELQKLKKASGKARHEGDKALVAEIENEISASPFGHWFEHGSSDLALYWDQKKFNDAHGLQGWPFED